MLIFTLSIQAGNSQGETGKGWKSKGMYYMVVYSDYSLHLSVINAQIRDVEIAKIDTLQWTFIKWAKCSCPK